MRSEAVLLMVVFSWLIVDADVDGLVAVIVTD
jgi:hypothetical protein